MKKRTTFWDRARRLKTLRGLVDNPKTVKKILRGEETVIMVPTTKHLAGEDAILPGEAFCVHLATEYGMRTEFLETTEPIVVKKIQFVTKKLGGQIRTSRPPYWGLVIIKARVVQNLKEVFLAPRRHPLHFA